MSVDEAISGHIITERKGSTMTASVHTVKTTIAPDEETKLASDAEYHDLEAWGLIKEYVSGPAKKSTDTEKKG